MMTFALWVVVFIASLTALVVAARYFTIAAERIGVYFGIPAFIVGVTIVAIGTSLPELVSSVLAVVHGSSEIVVGNVVGSNVTNIFLILGISAAIGSRLQITYELIHVDLPLLVGSAFLLAVTIWYGGFSLFDALLCLAAFAVYLHYTLTVERKRDDAGSRNENGKPAMRKLGRSTLPILVISAGFIYLGAEYTITSVIKLSEILQIGTEVIAVSAVALGTSLPELLVSVVAARRGSPDIAVGNILGSNIFNALVVMGVPGLFATLAIPEGMTTFALPMMLVATLLYLFITHDRQITRWEGLLLVVFYVFFIGALFNLT
ncbi:MAG: calcium/sodium antiporter [Chloroflexota bacterium]|nr:calcium/sodium antiporter [Chloroflexota bacterium]